MSTICLPYITPIAHFIWETKYIVGSIPTFIFTVLTIIIIMNTDVDECTLNTHNCEHTCENTIGSFLCGCNAGYELISDGRTCRGMNKLKTTI